LAAASTAGAAVLCAEPKKDGTFSASVKIREACKRNERALDLIAMGLVAPLSLVDGGATVRFTAVNVQVVSGSGATDAEPNGRGNVLIGHNERIPLDPIDDRGLCPGGYGPPYTRNGSHNLIVGPGHDYVGYGSIASGTRSHVGNYSAVVAGSCDAAEDRAVTISGEYNGAREGGIAIGGIVNGLDSDPPPGIHGAYSRGITIGGRGIGAMSDAIMIGGELGFTTNGLVGVDGSGGSGAECHVGHQDVPPAAPACFSSVR
jgi:hypothetical protein